MSLRMGGGPSRVLLPEGQQFRAQGQSGQLQRRVHDVWVKGFERGLALKFSQVGLCYFKDREHSIRIPRDHRNGVMSYSVLILTLSLYRYYVL